MHIYHKFGLFLIFIFSISFFHSDGAAVTTFHQISSYDNDYHDNYDDYYEDNDKTAEADLEPTQAQVLSDEAKKRLNPLITSTTTTMKSIFNLFNLPKRSNYVKDPICPEQCLCLEDFRFINCAYAQLKHVPPDIPTTAHILDLSHNQIEDIDHNAFQNLTKLEELNLMHNQIKYLNKQMFHGLTKLQRLKLSTNLLTNIEPDTFEEATDLTVLDLSNNTIFLKGNSSFLSQPSLVELNCRNCSWTQLYDNTFINTSALQVLRIDQNDFNMQMNVLAFKPLKYLIKLRLPDLEQNNIEKLCNLLQSIDNIGFKNFDISCYELVSGTPYNESIILATESKTTTNNKVNGNGNFTTLNKEQITKSEDTVFPELDDKQLTTNNSKIKDSSNSNNNITSQMENFSSEMEVSGFFVSTESTVITNISATQNSNNKSYQVPVSAETIDRMLIGLMIISVIGIIIGLICRNDVGGIKTKCCRSPKPSEDNAEVNETPAEEIPLNKIA